MAYTSKYLRIKTNPGKEPFLSFGRHKGHTKSLTSEGYHETNPNRAAKSMTEIMVLHLKELGYSVFEPGVQVTTLL
jgi:hypothetical protein